MKYKLSFTTEQLLFLSRIMKEYVDDEEEYRFSNEYKENNDTELSNLRLQFYKNLHNKLSNKIHK